MLVGHLTTIDLEFSGTAFAEPGLSGFEVEHEAVLARQQIE
jgi:hypothetical protein